MKTKEQIVVEFGHSADDRLIAARRIELYRALAATSSSAAVAAHFFHCADELTAAEKKIGQLVLDFSAGDTPAANGGAAG